MVRYRAIWYEFFMLDSQLHSNIWDAINGHEASSILSLRSRWNGSHQFLHRDTGYSLLIQPSHAKSEMAFKYRFNLERKRHLWVTKLSIRRCCWQRGLYRLHYRLRQLRWGLRLSTNHLFRLQRKCRDSFPNSDIGQKQLEKGFFRSKYILSKN